MAKQYVQHISGQGAKWRLHHEYTQANSHPEGTEYVVENEVPGWAELRLPRSEYVLCPPPERWVDVTAECELVASEDDLVHRGAVVVADRGYRYRKVHLMVQQPGGRLVSQEAIVIHQKVTA